MADRGEPGWERFRQRRQITLSSRARSDGQKQNARRISQSELRRRIIDATEPNSFHCHSSFCNVGYIPRVLSGPGIFASLLVIAACFSKLILPEYTSILDLDFISTGLSEVTTGLWLIVKDLNQESRALKA
jgi:hypothetical protein